MVTIILSFPNFFANFFAPAIFIPEDNPRNKPSNSIRSYKIFKASSSSTLKG